MKRYLSLLFLLLGTVFSQQIPHFLYITTPVLEIGSPLSGTLDQNDGQNFKDGSRTEVIQAYFEQGQAVEIVLKTDFDAFLTLYGPQKTVIATNDDAQDTFSSLIVSEILESGRYVIVISGYSQIDIGNYDIAASLLEITDDTLVNLGSSLNAFLSESDEVETEGKIVDKFRLELSQLTNLTITMKSVLMDTYLLIYKDGQLIAENDDVILEDDPQTDTDETGTLLDAQLRVSLEAGIYEIWATTSAAATYGFYQLSVSEE